mmetsp:Transcript_8557/g.20768  ORF Transcript_8557/g.20768 Transcript_8557/m.20768 type:complete len:456 (+) Transcript_8557:267-1634(+)
MALAGLKSQVSGARGGQPGGLVAKERQRLTVGQVAPDDLQKRARPSTNRGLIQFLKGNDTFACAASSASLRSSTGSVVFASETARRQNSFDEKRTTREGDATYDTGKLASMGIAVGCKKGMKPEAPNQDSYCFIHCPEDFTLYGVFDGHGANGHDVSNFCKEMLPKLFLSDPNRVGGGAAGSPANGGASSSASGENGNGTNGNNANNGQPANIERAFHDSFRKCQQLLENEMASSIDSRTSGTTCTMVYWVQGTKELHVAYCGDSRASVCFREKKGKPPVSGMELTRDHKPEIPEEKRRIEASGGCVIFDGYYNHRVFKRGTVYPGLNMSRAMGDVIGNREAGIVETPDYKCYTLDDSVEAFMLCSDGVWEFISCDEAAQICGKFRIKEGSREAANLARIAGDKGSGTELGQNKFVGKIDAEKAVEDLCRESYQRWMDDTGGEISDDITAMIHVL